MQATLRDFYNRVARRTDTHGTKINVAETYRVLGCYFEELSRLSSVDAAAVQATGLALAAKRRKRKGK